jgi:hypothetical protein
MFERSLTYDLGKTTRKTLKEIYNLPAYRNNENILNLYFNAVDKYNVEVEKRQQEKKDADKPRKALMEQFRRMKNSGRQSMNINLEKFKSIANALKYILQFGDKYFPEKKYNIIAGNIVYAVNQNTRTRLYDKLVDNIFQALIIQEGSDAELYYSLIENPKIKFELFEEVNGRLRINGDFFKYTHNLELDLSRYQIFNTISNKSNNEMFENCLIYALKQGGLNESKLTELRHMTKARNIPLCKLDEVCEKLEIRLNIFRETNKKDNRIFGKNYKEVYNIGLLDEHYFIIDTKTNINLFALKNYQELKDIANFNNIYEKNGKYYKYDNKRNIDSHKLISYLLDNKEQFLTTINRFEILHTSLHNNVKNEIVNLEYTPKLNENYKQIEIKNKKESKLETVNEYFDFETHTIFENKEKVHVPYLCCITDDNDNIESFIGKDCAERMLWYLEDKYKGLKKVCLIAHNASYDIRFLYKHLYNLKEITRGTKVISCDAMFSKTHIQIKDSYLLISMPLKSFPKTFKIKNTQKEVISYKMYNETDCIQKRFIDIELALTFIKQEGKDEKQFLFNIKKWNLQDGDKYDCIEYSKKYCEIDCRILKEGYNIFKTWMNTQVNINIDNISTIASLAHRFFIMQGCYEDVYELSSIPQSFIQKCVVGGRVMCSENKKIKFDRTSNKRIADFDAVSLYPSAMSRMDGFLKGLPKIIKNLNFNEIKNQDGYFVEIKIKSVGKHRKFPLMSYITEEGIRNFTNEMENKTMFVDKITLEDIIKYHEIEFDIIRGYYFDEGFNTKINLVINYIFDKRVELKKQKNSAEMVYKLIMNSGYGKSIMKEIEHEIKYFNNEKQMKQFVNTNYNWIETYEPLYNSKLWRVKLIKSLNSHFNIAQVGVSILSWSKRIMNEVMTLAEDNNINIYYQDTDSMHIEDNDIKKLAKIFYNKYNRELIGKKMGQFHTDFDLVDYVKIDNEGFDESKQCKNIYASRSIFLGKKCYIDELVGTTEKGEEKIDYHIRMKGISSSCIDYTWRNFKESNPSYEIELNSPFELYELLYSGNEIIFDMTENGQHDNFKTHSKGYITTLSEFKRKIVF